MAVSELASLRRRIEAFAPPPLFERLPSKLFGPLASPNRERYWALLCRLHAKRFGPDAPLPPSHGFSTREIVLDIEHELLDQDTWVADGDENPDTPINIRAIGLFNRLHEAGWLRIDQHGAEKTVTMRPAVSHFLTQLISFAESGPVFVSGKINSIDANLHLVMDRRASGDTLSEAAQQARNLLEHIRNTSTIIRDLMESLNADITPAQYVYRFFNDYIERVFIGDYRELRTREHPLSKRQQILRMVEDLDESPEERARLIEWYEQKRFSGDPRQAERQYDRDIQRLRELNRIDEYLNRLDDEIRRANKRALVYLDYRLRALRPVDQLVRNAVAAVNAGVAPALGDPFGVADLLSSQMLAEPRKLTERPAPSTLRKQAPSAEDMARSRLMLRARDARTVTAPKLAEFVRRQIKENASIDGHDMDIDTIADVRAYQTLATISAAISTKSERLKLATRVLARGFRVTPIGTDEEAHPYISSKRFSVSLLPQSKEKAK
jgi:hypothetical protein